MGKVLIVLVVLTVSFFAFGIVQGIENIIDYNTKKILCNNVGGVLVRGSDHNVKDLICIRKTEVLEYVK